MLELIGGVLIAHPLRALAIAAVFLVLHVAKGRMAPGHVASKALVWAGLLWGLYALWEWVVVTRSPEANIRVDLLVFYPVLILASAWALIRGWR